MLFDSVVPFISIIQVLGSLIMEFHFFRTTPCSQTFLKVFLTYNAFMLFRILLSILTFL